MFGKKKHDDTAAGAPAHGGSGGGSGGGSDGGSAFLERQSADNDAGARLERCGTTTTAVVTHVELVAEYSGPAYEPMDFTHPPQEYAVQADLRSADGTSFPATLPLFLDEIGDPPALGEQINVVFDPADRTDVHAKVAWRQQVPGGDGTPRWSVPTHCPNCGAAVDQSTESFSAHPTCAMCHQPLPSEAIG